LSAAAALDLREDKKDVGLVEVCVVREDEDGVLRRVSGLSNILLDSSSTDDIDRDCECRDELRGRRFGDRRLEDASISSVDGSSTCGLSGVDFDLGAGDVSSSVDRPRGESGSIDSGSTSSFSASSSALPVLENHVRRLVLVVLLLVPVLMLPDKLTVSLLPSCVAERARGIEAENGALSGASSWAD
jgi:hypothetical protein